MSQALATCSGSRVPQPYWGAAASFVPSNSFGVIPAQTTAEAKTAQVVKKTLGIPPQKSLWQTMTQPKVLIAAGTMGAVAGAAAACYFFPVATAAHAATMTAAGRAVAINTHQLLIHPGIANSLLLADLLLKIAVIPAVKFSLPFLLPVISTVIVTTVGMLILLHVANKVWDVAKVAMRKVLSAFIRRINHECDKTYTGMAFKKFVIMSLFPCLPPHILAQLYAFLAPEAETVSTEPGAAVAQEEVPQIEDDPAKSTGKERIVTASLMIANVVSGGLSQNLYVALNKSSSV